MEPDIMSNVYQSIAEAKNHDLYRNKNFYVVLLLNVERLGGVPRTRVFVRQSCPTPVFKQVVWKYHYLSGSLEYLWTIPDSIRYYHILKNPGKYANDKNYGQTSKFVHLDHSGELLEWVKKENGEKKEGILRVIDKQDTEIIKG
jgi:hypothetical protein